MSEERILTGTRCFDLSTNLNNLTILDQGNKISIVTEAAAYIVTRDAVCAVGMNVAATAAICCCVDKCAIGLSG